MKKLFLHIGFHKTGTSSLQEYLNQNREALQAHNVFYPESFKSHFPGNVDLSWAFNKSPPAWSTVNDENKEFIFDFYKQQIENTDCDNIIISSEDFVLLDTQPSTIQNIKDYFVEFDVQVIAYLREPIDFMASLYCHAVRSRSVAFSLKKYIAEVYSFRSADYSLRLLPWTRVFGKENIIVKKYEPSEFVNNSLMCDFFDAINIELTLENTLKRANVGVHPWLVGAYIQVGLSDMVEQEKQKKLREISRIGLELPKVNAAKYLLEKDDLMIVKRAYDITIKRLKRDFNLDFNAKST